MEFMALRWGDLTVLTIYFVSGLAGTRASAGEHPAAPLRQSKASRDQNQRTVGDIHSFSGNSQRLPGDDQRLAGDNQSSGPPATIKDLCNRR